MTKVLGLMRRRSGCMAVRDLGNLKEPLPNPPRNGEGTGLFCFPPLRQGDFIVVREKSEALSFGLPFTLA